MPSRGRYKVYLIDEVHMLSKAAFNALLKTLEEPPEHVKFLFATTDPEKLLVTVLSRCLQFNLKRLDEAQIGGQITRIIEAEGIAADPGAVRQLAKAADGSLRDGLSLLDQAIAYTGAGSGGGRLDDAAVAIMLGTVDRTQVGTLLEALAAGEGARLLATVAALAEFSPDWGSVLDALADALHRVQVKQLVPDVAVPGEHVDVEGLAARLRPELVQLWYQMALNGRRELPFAPSPRAGFEMSVLRMLAFRPADAGVEGVGSTGGNGGSRNAAMEAKAALQGAPAAAPAAASARPAASPEQRSAPTVEMAAWSPPLSSTSPPSPSPAPSPMAEVSSPASPSATGSASTIDADRWLELVANTSLRGPSRELAAHAGFIGYADGVLKLSLPAADEHLKAPGLVKALADALAPALGAAPQIRFEAMHAAGETLHQRSTRERDARQLAAEDSFISDPGVQQLISRHGAKVVPDSIRPFDE